MEVTSKVGITGNLYIWSPHKVILEAICKKIGKSVNSIYWNNRYQNVVRIKDKKQKKLAKKVLSSLINTPLPKT